MLFLGLPLSSGLSPVCWEPPTHRPPPLHSLSCPPHHWDLLQLQDSTHELSQVTFTSFLPLLPDTQGGQLCTVDFFGLLPSLLTCLLAKVLLSPPSQCICHSWIPGAPVPPRSHCTPLSGTPPPMAVCSPPLSVGHTFCPKTAFESFALSCIVLFGKSQLPIA